MEEIKKLTTQEKALQINLSKSIYGSFAEIGAGQEVAANFFKVGGASGTIAKTISAYDAGEGIRPASGTAPSPGRYGQVLCLCRHRGDS
jgi:hypothetical protein